MGMGPICHELSVGRLTGQAGPRTALGLPVVAPAGAMASNDMPPPTAAATAVLHIRLILRSVIHPPLSGPHRDHYGPDVPLPTGKACNPESAVQRHNV